MKDSHSKMKTVYTVVERDKGKSFWLRVGIGFVNKDGSINLKLDAMPVNGNLQIRDYESVEERQERFQARSRLDELELHAELS